MNILLLGALFLIFLILQSEPSKKHALRLVVANSYIISDIVVITWFQKGKEGDSGGFTCSLPSLTNSKSKN